MTEFGVLGGQRFIVCAVCHGVIALPEWQHVARTTCQGQAPAGQSEPNERQNANG